MSDDEEFFPSFFRKRWRFPLDNWFEDFERNFEEMFEGTEMPKELVRERKLPNGGTIREVGPFVYGYSFSMGADGKPVIREFGNVKPSIEGGRFGMPKPKLAFKEEREPLVDTIVHDDAVKVVAELPGVDKSDISLQCDGRRLMVRVETSNRRYYKELQLPVEVDPDTTKASYKNGVLELILTRKTPGLKPKQIRID